MVCVPKIIFAEKVNFALRDAVNLTLTNNSELINLRNEIKKEKEKLVFPKYPNNPELSFAINNNLNPKDTFYKGSDISISMPIEITGQKILRKNIVKKRIEIIKTKLKKLTNDLSYQTADKFIEIYFLQKKIRETETLLTISNKLLKQTKIKSETGQLSFLNLNTAILQSSLLSDDISALKNELSRKKNELELIMNDRMATNAVFVFSVQEELPDIHSLIEYAKKNNPAISLLKQNAKIDSINIRLLDMQNKISMISPYLGLSQEGKSISTGIGISFPIPIFNKKIPEKNILHSEIKIKKIKIRQIREQINNKMENYYSNLINDKKRIDNYKTNIIPLVKKNLNLSESLYASGEIGYSDIEKYWENLYNAQIKYLDLLNDYYKIIYQIKKLSGKTIR